MPNPSAAPPAPPSFEAPPRPSPKSPPTRLSESIAEALTPAKTIDIGEWSEANIKLLSVNASQPGAYRLSLTPYAREIYAQLSASSPTQKVVLMWAAQLSKTQIILNTIASVIAQDPGPILFTLPDLDVAKSVSAQRLTPQLLACKATASKIFEDTSAYDTTTALKKTFAGGVLLMSGARSPAALRSMPIRVLVMDEIDAYPLDVGSEGSPVSLAEKRCTTYRRRKICLTSTPTVKGLSAIEKEIQATDYRRYFVPCPHCGAHQHLQFSRLVYNPETLHSVDPLYRCEHCEELFAEKHKPKMLAYGYWQATQKSKDPLVVGYHLNALYSPIGWKSWKECCVEYEDALTDPLKLKTFVNTVLAETFEEKGDSIATAELSTRLESFPAEVPDGVVALTCSADVQDDRVEAAVIGWGKDEESWLIAHTTCLGSPADMSTWDELTAFRTAGFKRADGTILHPIATAIDSGGHFTDQVYKYCAAFEKQHVFAIKGRHDGAIIGRFSRNNRYKCRLAIVGTHAAKLTLLSRLRINKPSPGYIHLPDWLDEEHIAQLTSEKLVRRWKKNQGSVQEWVKTRARNELWDLLVYNLAALHSRGVSWVQKTLGSRKLVGTKANPLPAATDADATATTDTDATTDAPDATTPSPTPPPAPQAPAPSSRNGLVIRRPSDNQPAPAAQPTRRKLTIKVGSL